MRRQGIKAAFLLAAAAAGLLCALSGSAQQADASLVYELDYEAVFQPAAGTVDVGVQVRQRRDLLRSVSFEFDPRRYRDFQADGELEVSERAVVWQPPAEGGRLAFSLQLDHQRGGGGYDSLMRTGWALFRGDDLLPPVAARTLKGARSKSRLRFDGPTDWSWVTPYPRDETDSNWFVIERTGRRFDRPVGWMAGGRLGVRWETIAERKVAVAGPTGQGIRRLDMLAFLRWNLPELVRLYPNFNERLLIVSGGDPMWRGGLSGPASLYIHSERPLISGNGTSTLLHELLHVAQGYRAERDADWIVEGMAEYYTLELMRRSGTISAARAERGYEKLDEWAESVDDLAADRSSGARTARGVAVMRALDQELRRRSERRYSLDDVARALAESAEPVTLERLRTTGESLVGGPLESLSAERLALP